MLFPVYWMLISSLTPTKYLMSLPPNLYPREANLRSYGKIFSNAQYLTFFKNSFIVAAGTVLLTLVLSALAGYAFSRYRFRGHNALMTAILSVQMFPIVAILISLYTFYYKWELISTYRGLILADTTFCLPLAIMMMKGFFDTLPRSLDEAAKIDGAGRLKTLITILIPLTLPGLVAIGIYTFLYSWDDFVMSLVIMQSDAMKTLPVGIAASFLGEYAYDYSSMMAFACIGSAPIVLLFIFFQKYMIAGLTSGAVKG
jgi:multiple sugar transport system permease protein